MQYDVIVSGSSGDFLKRGHEEAWDFQEPLKRLRAKSEFYYCDYEELDPRQFGSSVGNEAVLLALYYKVNHVLERRWVFWKDAAVGIESRDRYPLRVTIEIPLQSFYCRFGFRVARQPATFHDIAPRLTRIVALLPISVSPPVSTPVAEPDSEPIRVSIEPPKLERISPEADERWLRDNRDELGDDEKPWLAVSGEKVVTRGASLNEVYEVLKQQNIDDALVEHVPVPESPRRHLIA